MPLHWPKLWRAGSLLALPLRMFDIAPHARGGGGVGHLCLQSQGQHSDQRLQVVQSSQVAAGLGSQQLLLVRLQLGLGLVAQRTQRAQEIGAAR